MTLFKHLDQAVQDLIREANQKIILPAFYEQIADSLIRIKTDHSIVTQIDYDAQDFLQQRLQALLPQSGFLGEEETSWSAPLDSAMQQPGDWVWILDPIDGTHNFAVQNNNFGTLLSLWHLPSHRPVYGWIYLPISNQMFSGGQGEGVFYNGTPLHRPTAIEKTLAEMSGLLNYGSFGHAKDVMQANSRHFRTIDPSSCAAVKFVALIQDRADFAVFGRAKIWDLSAGIALLEEMGGYASRVSHADTHYHGLSLTNPTEYAGWLLAVRDKDSWPQIREHLFENIEL